MNSTLCLLQKTLGHTFGDLGLLETSLIHRSYWNEHKHLEEHNERLEFLGDAVLGAVVSSYLYREFPEKSEGSLSFIRSRVVDAKACARYIEQLEVASYLRLGRGEQMNVGRGRISVMANFFEALIGALFLDAGYGVAEAFILDNFSSHITSVAKEPEGNHKAELQDLMQKNWQVTPTYRVIAETGPEHNKSFEVAVFWGERSIGVGCGSSKKIAQQRAAQEAKNHLRKELP